MSSAITPSANREIAVLDALPTTGPRPDANEAPPAHVLVVEDDLRSARLIAAHLQGTGCRVSLAGSAAAAQDQLNRELPDLVLCDVCMPETNGIQFTAWVRASFPEDNLPIALITSSDDAKILSRGLQAGADDFLAKPVNPLELRTPVRSLLRTKKLLDELRQRERASAASGMHAAACDSAANEAPARQPVVVVVEDNPGERRLLQAHLKELACRLYTADDATTGLKLLQDTRSDLVILDLLLPDRSGYELIAAVKSDPLLQGVPVLVVSALSEVQDRVKALELGADDYIVKGFDRSEFEARVRRLLRLKGSLDQLSSRCDQALRLAATDSLTGLHTRAFMYDKLHELLDQGQPCGPCAVVFADVDHFKQANDRHGHHTGDQVLRRIAEALRKVIRRTDILIRYGGEELVALLPGTGREGAVMLAERMRMAVEALRFDVEGTEPLSLTVSLGVAVYPLDASCIDELIQSADGAMYRAKEGGRNRVSVCQGGAIEQLTAAAAPKMPQ